MVDVRRANKNGRDVAIRECGFHHDASPHRQQDYIQCVSLSILPAGGDSQSSSDAKLKTSVNVGLAEPQAQPNVNVKCIPSCMYR